LLYNKKAAGEILFDSFSGSMTPSWLAEGEERIEDGNCLYLRLGDRRNSEMRMTGCGNTGLAFVDR